MNTANRMLSPRAMLLAVIATALLASCAVNPETQAKMDEFANTIPTCSGDADCASKWATARRWTAENSDFSIRGESDTRINASSNIISQSGIGVVVTRVAVGTNLYQIVADLECFSAYSCPELWDMKLDFNRTLNGSN